ncbi:MAG: uroporphyrinogen-III C-methyltransferase [Chloroflexi bacterium]|nr:uroporphyrinogen-III C-methyltransferase [Chloroflexota bacterium]
MARRGMVSLVGAGPGDPELLTLRGLRCLRSADVVVYDRLIDPRILDDVPAGAERVFAGKAPGMVMLDQRGIEAVLIDRARAGKRVVRLKGGDPFVFGRGGEEVEALVAADVPYEVVPGVTSAVAVPASAGIPVTHRELSSTVTIVTGHEDPDKPGSSVDWSWLARGNGTLVILMGLERLDTICHCLIAGGRAWDTPAAAVSSGTLPQQRSVTAPLAHLAGAAAEADLRSPAVIVVGEVARFPDILAETASSVLAHAV